MGRALGNLVVVLAVIGLSGCWLQPGFGSERTAYNPLESTVGPSNVGRLHVVWNVALGASPAHDPVVVPGKVLVTDDGGLYALDWATGAVVWHNVLDPNGGGTGDATVNGPSVYVPDFSRQATRSFDVQTGQEQAHVASGDYGAAIVRGSKVVSDHAGFGMVSSVGVEVDDLSDPTQSWASTEGIRGGGFNDPAPTSAAVASDRFVFGLGGSVVAYTLAPPTCPAPRTPPLPTPCTPLWSTPVGFTASVPVIDNASVFAGTATGLSVLLATNGESDWYANLGAAVAQPPAVANGVAYAGTADGRLAAFSVNTCRHNPSPCSPSWTANLPSPMSAQPAVANGIVYTASADGTLEAFAANGCPASPCRPLWTTNTGSQVTGAPAITLGRLIVATTNGHVIAYAT
ncbi:MAG: PQQ-binding-like beta-propeller repeat protein [Actinomycetota bacterium]|nr:PQQ-binding-like beta-propeller repeat protein [Actinomycetota bacterium]